MNALTDNFHQQYKQYFQEQLKGADHVAKLKNGWVAFAVIVRILTRRFAVGTDTRPMIVILELSRMPNAESIIAVPTKSLQQCKAVILGYFAIVQIIHTHDEVKPVF
jgi:hypothetical protein